MRTPSTAVRTTRPRNNRAITNHASRRTSHAEEIPNRARAAFCAFSWLRVELYYTRARDLNDRSRRVLTTIRGEAPDRILNPAHGLLVSRRRHQSALPAALAGMTLPEIADRLRALLLDSRFHRLRRAEDMTIAASSSSAYCRIVWNCCVGAAWSATGAKRGRMPYHKGRCPNITSPKDARCRRIDVVADGAGHSRAARFNGGLHL